MEGQYERVSQQSRELLYSVPAALCDEIARAATAELAERLRPFWLPLNRGALNKSIVSVILLFFWRSRLQSKTTANDTGPFFGHFLGSRL